MKRIALILLCLILTGCAYIEEAVRTEKSKDVQETQEPESHTVFVSRAQGVVRENNTDFFKGADITGDINVSGIAEFEKIAGTHDVYADEIYIDEPEKAGKFMLECYAAGKTPYIIMKNREGVGEEQFKAGIDAFAQALGEYQIDVMVEILENSYYYDGDGEKYKYAAEKIAAANAMAKFVWSVKQDDIILIGKYMPAEYVDYICVNGYFSEAAVVGRLFSGMPNTGCRVIVRFGASSYSSQTCTYTATEAAKTIEAVYDGARADTDIAGIIYMDKNERLFDGLQYTDYSVTTDRGLTESYKEIIEENVKGETEGDKQEYGGEGN